MDTNEHGLYIIKDTYFERFKSSHWMQNKNEKRPHYYALRGNDGILWMIPLSTKVENYKAKILKEEQRRGVGNCIYYHIGKIASNERAFLIGDMFPVTEQYIKNPFTISGVPYIVKNAPLNSVLYSKAMRFLALVEQGKIKSRTNILGIRKKLRQDLNRH